MVGQPGFFDFEECLAELSAKGDDLERLTSQIAFEMFRPDSERAVPRSNGSKRGRPPFDHVLMFKVLILQVSHNLSYERTEYLIKDRLSFMRFLSLGLGDRAPNENTIRDFHEALSKAGAINVLFSRFGRHLRSAGYVAMGGQIVDATILSAPKQRNKEDEKRAIKEGRIPEDWPSPPSWPRRIAMPAGRSNTPRPNPGRMAQSRSILRSPPSVTRTISRSTTRTD